MADFMALEKCIQISIREGSQLLQIEGDSMISILCVQNILNGQPARKILKSWRLEGIVENINGFLDKLEYVVV